MTETEMLERVQGLENRLAAMVERWNAFIDPAQGGVNRPRIASLEQRPAAIETWFKPENGKPGTTLIVAGFREAAEAMKVINQRIVDNEAKAEAAAEGALRYRGTYAGGATQYKQGDVVTHGGALHYCFDDAPGKPGTGAGWQLMFKTEGT